MADLPSRATGTVPLAQGSTHTPKRVANTLPFFWVF
jgi:hypothetical protein